MQASSSIPSQEPECDSKDHSTIQLGRDSIATQQNEIAPPPPPPPPPPHHGERLSRSSESIRTSAINARIRQETNSSWSSATQKSSHPSLQPSSDQNSVSVAKRGKKYQWMQDEPTDSDSSFKPPSDEAVEWAKCIASVKNVPCRSTLKLIRDGFCAMIKEEHEWIRINMDKFLNVVRNFKEEQKKSLDKLFENIKAVSDSLTASALGDGFIDGVVQLVDASDPEEQERFTQCVTDLRDAAFATYKHELSDNILLQLGKYHGEANRSHGKAKPKINKVGTEALQRLNDAHDQVEKSILPILQMFKDSENRVQKLEDEFSRLQVAKQDEEPNATGKSPNVSENMDID